MPLAAWRPSCLPSSQGPRTLQLGRSAAAALAAAGCARLRAANHQVLQLLGHVLWAGAVPQHGPDVLAGGVWVVPRAVQAGLQVRGEAGDRLHESAGRQVVQAGALQKERGGGSRGRPRSGTGRAADRGWEVGVCLGCAQTVQRTAGGSKKAHLLTSSSAGMCTPHTLSNPMLSPERAGYQ